MWVNRRQVLWGAGGLTLAQPGSAMAAEADDVADFDTAMARRLAGALPIRSSLAVAYRGRLVHARGYGGAAAGDRFLLASTSKAITAAAIATLVQDSKLTLETSVGDALAGLFARYGPPRDRRVKGLTVHQLLTHTAGLATTGERDPTLGSALIGLLADKAPDRLTKLDLFRHALGVDLQAPPGQGYLYSNLGYLYLGLIVEMATEQRYETYCQARVLHPAGVAGAAIDPDLGFADAFGGWTMSAPALVKFLQIFEPGNPAVLGGRFHRFLQTPSAAEVPLPDGGMAYYTLGLYLRRDGAGPVWWHPGALEFHSATLNRSTASLIARGDNGASWAALYTPQPSLGPPGRIDFLATARQIRHWPAVDQFPRFGLPPGPRD